jgi:hypothetical protein
MNKYNDIEIQTAKNLLKEGYKWIVRYEIGRLIALSEKPIKSNNNLWTTTGNCVCVGRFIPIFQGIRSDDKEPVSLESIVHPQILDDVERRYLRAVIRPFRKRVEYISKEEDFDGPFDGPAEFIQIELSDGDIANFPDFKANTMYKGMKTGKEYSLEELGL